MITIICGEEDFLVEQCVQQEAMSYIPDSITEYEFPKDRKLFDDDLDSKSFLVNKRVFIIRGSDTVSGFPEEENIILIFSKKPSKIPNNYKVFNFKKLKTFNNNNEVIKWINDVGKKQFRLDLSRIAGALFLNNGGNLRKIYSEIEKISLISSEGDCVSPDIAKSVMCFSADLSPKSIIDSICSRDILRSLTFYDRLQEHNEETGWIIAYLQRFISNQFRFNVLSQSKLSIDEISEILGIHPYVVVQTVEPNKDIWNNEFLKDSFFLLCKLDELHKSGKNMKFMLELEIMRIVENANDK